MQAFSETISRLGSGGGVVVVLGTGGTIAGTASRADDVLGYSAAQIGVKALLAGAIGVDVVGCRLEPEQVSQVDSKDMGHAIWALLAQRIEHHLGRSEVTGVVVTHGTDTIEETAFFLQCVLAPSLVASKAVVLTCAMRPATAVNPDGPQNLRDAVHLASKSTVDSPASPALRGVMVVCAGVIHSPMYVQKVHPTRLDPFDSGDGPLLGHIGQDGLVIPAPNRLLESVAPMPMPDNALRAISWPVSGPWPRVEIVMNHAGASGAVVDALLAAGQQGKQPVSGIVVAGTGNGSVHDDLLAALLRAKSFGVRVVRCSRCAFGTVQPVESHPLPEISPCSPAKARIKLMLELIPAA